MRRVQLSHHRMVPVLAAMFLAAGCGKEPVDIQETPPDLTGAYELVSLKRDPLPPVGPPDATGTFAVRQTSVTGQEASGTFSMNVEIPGLGNLKDDGTYKNRFDKTWEQSGNLQTKGTYTLSSDTLTVRVTEPANAVSTTVWKRR